MNSKAHILWTSAVVLIALFFITAEGCSPGVSQQVSLDQAMERAVLDDDLSNVIVLQKSGCSISKAPPKTNPDPAFIMRTPLSLALFHHCDDIVDYLLRDNVDVNATNSDGSTAIYYADSLDSAKRMIDDGADINVVLNDRGAMITPLNNARLQRNGKLVRYFLSNGALDPFPQAPIFFPMCQRSPDGAGQLLFGIVYGSEAASPLVSATGNGRLDVIKKLAISANGVNVRDKGLWESTPLAIAVLRGYTNAVQYLLERGADVNAQNQTGTTPLMDAVAGMQNSLDIASILMRQGADPKIKDSNGFTVFDYASLSGNTNFFQILRAVGNP